MTHPSAPMLQAEYHNYNEQSAFNDYYGGYEQRSGTWSGNGPRRMDTTAEKNPSRCRTSSTHSIHCLNALVVLRSLIVLTLLAIAYQGGYRHEYMYYLAAFECVSLFASVLMCCGIEHRQPFFCILFTVFRSVETFLCLFFALAFGYSIWDRKSDSARYVVALTRDTAHTYFPKANIGWEDLAFQLMVAGFIISLFLLAYSLYVCRVSWTATTWATDEMRKQKNMRKHEVSRVMVASDELYTNY